MTARRSVEERRAQLVEAAVRVIARDGVVGASTRAVTTEAGIPLGQLHYAFGTREALLDAVIAHVTDTERIAVQHAHVPPGATGRDALAHLLRTGFEGYLDLLAADPARETALLDLFVHSLRRGDAAPVPQYVTYYDVAAETLAHAAAVTGCTWRVPPADAARMLVVTLDGLTTTWLADRDDDAARRAAALHADLLAGLADPTPAPEGDDRAH